MDIPSLSISNEDFKNDLLKKLQPLVINQEKCARLKQVFDDELEKGLIHGLDGSSIQMENTYIPELLDGTEWGQYLALDLGGTNFRVIMLELECGKIKTENIKYYTVEENLRLGPGMDLFLFLAKCIKDFLTSESLLSVEYLPLGFTFSFPMTQKALDQGFLVNWTKSFNCPGVIGQDVVAMLNTALSSAGVSNVHVVAILNDTTGTLIAGSHDFQDASIGLILGTGCNGSYIEKAGNISRWEGSKEGVEQAIMDPEWGAFGDNGSIDFIKTDWDRELDKSSLLPGSFTYEKYFAGKYLGELVRLVLCGVMPPNSLPQQVRVPSFISTKNVSEIIEGSYEDVEVWKLLEEDSRAVLSYICKLLSERAALLVAVPLSNFLNRMKRPSSTIAVTGSLFQWHPTLAKSLERQVLKMSNYPFSLQLSEDGSGKGAGLVAAIAHRLRKRNK